MKKFFVKAISAIAAAALLVAAVVMPRPVLAATENVGAADCTSGWWGAHSSIYRVYDGQVVTFKFVNHSSKANNWNNAVVVLQNTATGHSAADNADYKEYAVLRADNYGWGEGYGTAVLDSNYDWNNFTGNIDGVTMTVTVAKVGKTANVAYNFTGTDGVAYHQTYTGITNDGVLYASLTVDGCYLENVEAATADQTLNSFKASDKVVFADLTAGLINLNDGVQKKDTSLTLNGEVIGDYFVGLKPGSDSNNSKVAFTVNADKAGDYDITLIYNAKGSTSRPLAITVNGKAKDVQLAMTDNDSYTVCGTTKISVHLNKGANTIAFSQASTFDDTTVKAPNIVSATFTLVKEDQNQTPNTGVATLVFPAAILMLASGAVAFKASKKEEN